MREQKLSQGREGVHPAAARRARGLTQRGLAALVPTTQATVNRLEREGVFPRQRALRAAYLAVLGLVEVNGVVRWPVAGVVTRARP